MLGLRVFYDPAFDDGVWPGPGTAAGEAWVGTEGLLSLLESRLGLTAPRPGRALRAASIVARLRDPGFWSRSAQVDPLGTAERLLRWRDTLAMGGWRFQGLTPRLADLAALTSGSEGLPDRLRDVLAELSCRRSPLQDLIVLALPATRLERDLLHALQGRAGGLPDRSGGCVARLLRPGGPLQAAEQVAAWLACRKADGPLVLVSPAAVLDPALLRHGLPTLGLSGPPGQEALLQALPLVLACGWSPPDPERVLELVNLPQGPVPRKLGWKLARALQDWPSVASPAFRQALETGLEELEPPLRRMVAGVLRGEASRARGYPSDLAERRAGLLADWFRGRPGPYQQCRDFQTLLRATGLGVLTEQQLRRLVALATQGVTPDAVHPSCAGLARVGLPGGVAGPAASVVWWNFTRSALHRPLRQPLSADEEAALRAAGVELPDPSGRARAEAASWRRPWLYSRELLLVCPHRKEDGLPEYPHPFRDELAHVTWEAEVPRVQRARLPLPGARPRLKIPPEALPTRSRESAASLARLVSCPLSWVLADAAGIRAGRTQRLPSESTLLGSLVHEVLARLLSERGGDAPGRAGQLFDELGPQLAAPLFMPGADSARARARHVCALAAESLTRHLLESGLEVLHVEISCERDGPGFTVEGRLDLVVGPPETVVDLKWSGAGRFRELLERGTAHQLAVYGFLRGASAAAYFTLLDRALLTSGRSPFRSARSVAGPTMAETWRAMASAIASRQAELAEGRVEAPGNAGSAEPLLVPSSCDGCAAGVVCGRACDG